MPQLPPAQPPALKPFIFHGVYATVNEGTNQAIADCPFCTRDGKFYINTQDTLWNCFGCSKSGNSQEFIRELYEESLSRTTEEEYQELQRDRKLINVETIRHWGLAVSPLRNEWILPGYYYGSDKLKSLYRYTDYSSKEGKKRCWLTPTFDHCLYGVKWYDKDKPDVYLTEGPWDGMAFWELMRSLKPTLDGYDVTGAESSSLLANANVLAVPSANVFNQYWAKLLTGKRVFILPHNDHPRIENDRVHDPAAWVGMKRLVRQIVEWDIRPKEIQYVAWGGEKDHNAELKHGYDVRDLLTEGCNFLSGRVGPAWRLNEIQRRSKQLDKLLSMLRPVPNSWVDPTSRGDTLAKRKITGSNKGKSSVVALEPEPCNDWKILVEQWGKATVWHRGLDKGLSFMLAVIASTMQAGSQLWGKVIGPPSCGKSMLCDALCVNRDYVTPKSEIRGFYSGFRAPKAETGGEDVDFGLLGEILNKTFITKDGDTLLQSVNKDRILAQARDLYDGRSESHFLNGQGKQYENMRTTWLLCGTESLRALDTSELGERFIDCVLMDGMPPELERKIGKSAIRRMFKLMRVQVDDKAESMDDEDRVMAKKLTAGYVEYLRTNINALLSVVDDNLDDATVDNLYDYGLFVAFMRSRPSAKQEEKAMRELSVRLPEQFARLAGNLAVVLNKERVDQDVLNRVKDIAFDTARGVSFDMTRVLYRAPAGIELDRIVKMLNQKEDKVKDLARFLKRIGALETYTESAGRLQGATKYRLTKQLRSICDRVFQD